MNDSLNFNIGGGCSDKHHLLSDDRASFKMIVLTIIVAMMVLILDLLLPLGVAGAVPYVMLILMGIWFPNPRHVFLLAALGTILNIIGCLGLLDGDVYWVVLINHGMSLFAIWVTAFLIFSRKKFENELLLSRNNLEFAIFERTRELVKSEARFRAVAQSAHDGIVSLDKDGLIMQWNSGAQHMFGYDEDEIIDQSATTLMPERYREAHTKGFRHFMANETEQRPLGGRSVELEALRKNGKEFPIELTLSGWRIDDEIFVTAIIRDITERQHAREQLLDAKNEAETLNKELVFQKFALDTHAIVSITDVKGSITYVNDKFCEISGYSREELIGQNHGMLKSDEHSEAFYKDLWTTIANGKTWNGEIKNIKKDGDFYWVSATILPFMNEQGKPFQYVAIRTDISANKAMEGVLHKSHDELEQRVEERTYELSREVVERKRAEEQANIANRTKSELLANMSHELRTPLNAIIGFSESMKDGLFGPVGSEKNREYLYDIYDSGHHLLGIINDILDVSAIEAGAIILYEENINLAHVVDDSIRLVKLYADSGQVIVTSFIDPETPLVHADKRRIKQVFLNLLNNAVKFTPEGGKVTVTGQLNNSGGLVVTITDTGIGMDEDGLSKALSTFGQVDSGYDRKHEGTGLGLPLTKGLIELHGGAMKIKSKKGHGTSITVTFPKERVVQNTCSGS